MERKFKRGDKVVPHSKTWIAKEKLEDCHYWREVKENGQGYLYILNYDETEECYILNSEFSNSLYDGNYYQESDLTFYKKEKEKEKENKQEVITIKSQPHYVSRIYTYQNGNKDVVSDLYKEETMQVIYNGTTTIVILNDGSKGISKLNPNDKFDKKKGFQIAVRRAYLNKLQKELKELTK